MIGSQLSRTFPFGAAPQPGVGLGASPGRGRRRRRLRAVAGARAAAWAGGHSVGRRGRCSGMDAGEAVSLAVRSRCGSWRGSSLPWPSFRGGSPVRTCCAGSPRRPTWWRRGRARSVLSFLDVKGTYPVLEKADREGEEGGQEEGQEDRGNHKPPPEHVGQVFVSPDSGRAVRRGHPGVHVGGRRRGRAGLRPRCAPTSTPRSGRSASPGGSFDEVRPAAMHRVVPVKFPDGEVELVAKGRGLHLQGRQPGGLPRRRSTSYGWGPTNGKAIQATLRRFAEAAGLPVKAAAP